VTDVLDGLDPPALLTTGPDDPMWTVASARAAAAHLRTGEAVVLPGAGHVGPLLQCVPEVAELVIHFWREPLRTIERQAAISPRGGTSR
jgi:pimeloyl-ACP methyl ester carboxylesterase